MERWSKVINFEDVGKHYGSPLYIFSPQQLKENFDSYLNFTLLPEYIKYPIKTNPSLDILRYIAKFGGGADCAHNSEVQLALAAGISYERIIYNTPAPEKELTLKLLYAGADVVFDSVDFLDFIEKQVDLPNVKGRIFARILPNIEIPYLDIKNALNKDNAHADHNSKFGIEPEELLHYCRRHTKLKLSGLHMHPGTRLDNIDAFIKTIQVMNKVAEELSSNTPHFITILDIGGGLGILYKPDDIYPSMEEWTSKLTPLKNPKFQYYVESGNSLVGNTMGLLSKIILIKKRSKKNLQYWMLAMISFYIIDHYISLM
jgi:diaminopimelate decarboxylase